MAAVFAGCSASADFSAESPEADISIAKARVEVASVTRQTAKNRLTLTGEVRGSRDATLASANGGLVENVRVEAGQIVTAGTQLVTVDRSLTKARMTQVEARATQAKRETERLRKLGDGVSKAQLERAETELIIAEAAVAEAKAMFARSSIVAPFSGTVADVFLEVGEFAPPGTPIVHLIATDPVTVRVSVSDRNVVALREGLAVDVVAAARPNPFQGTLTQIRAAANPRTRAFFADITVDNPDGLLLPGMIATVTTTVEFGEQVVLPQDWIVMRAQEQGVFVLNNEQAAWRDVELGQVLGNQVVVNGLQPDDNVIFSGHRNLLDGDAVIVSRTAVCCDSGRPIFE